MALAAEDLRDFTRFADEKLKNDGVSSLVELAGPWKARRRGQESGITNHVIDVDLETLRGLAKAFPNVQDEDRLQWALARRGGLTTAVILGKAILAASRAGRL